MAKTPKKAPAAEPEPSTDNKLPDYAKLLLKLKGELKAMDEAHAKNTAELKADIALVTQLFAETAHETGITSVSTPDGTVGIGKRTFYKTDDVAALREFAFAHDETALLSMTLSSAGLKDYMERNDGAMPPTVYQAEIEEVYNRPKSKAKKALA